MKHAMLPNLNIYMNEDIAYVNGTFDKKVTLTQGGTTLWQRKVSTASSALSATDNNDQVRVIRSSSANYMATLYTSELDETDSSTSKPVRAQSHSLVFDAKIFEDNMYLFSQQAWKNFTTTPTTTTTAAVTNASNTTWTTVTVTVTTSAPGEWYQVYPEQRGPSSQITLTFSVCTWGLWTPSNKVLHLYSSFGSSTGAKRFRINIPAAAVKSSAHTTLKNSASTFFLKHEATAPTFDLATSTPSHSGTVALTENLVMSFSEIVQAGTGSFEVWDITDSAAPHFKIDVSKILSSAEPSNGHHLISGKKISITPKTLCDGTPACTDLVATKTYYVTTSGPGVVKDHVGNKLDYVETKGTWSFKATSVNTATDTDAPSVAFVGGAKLVSTRLTGWVYFSEKVQAAASKKVHITDCGTDFTCNTGDTLYSADTLTWGSGASSTTNNYGMLKFVSGTGDTLAINKKYQVKIQSATVKDYSSASSGNTGPAADYTFYVSTGNYIALKDGSDTDGPTIVSNGYSPSDASTNVDPVTANIVLWFNEEVQAALGSVSFCTTSDATAGEAISGSTTNCAANQIGVNSVDLPLETAGSNFAIDRRKVTINPSYDFKIGQKLYMVMPEGLIRDTTGANPQAKIDGTAYSFTVKDADTVKPHADYVTTTTLKNDKGGKVTIHFSEAVQVATSGGSGPIGNVSISTVVQWSTVISGNKAEISGNWLNGETYKVHQVDTYFKDLSGNMAWNNDTETGTQFVITSDDAAPTAEYFPPNSNVIDPFDVLTIQFNEVVTKGSGKVSVYSGASAIGSSTGSTLMQEIDVSDLDLVTILERTGTTARSRRSSVNIGVSTKFMCGTTYKLRVPSTMFLDPAGNAFTSCNAGSCWTAAGRVEKDTAAPRLRAANLGASATWSSASAQGTADTSLVMYFSEHVARVSGQNMYLGGSTGNSNCDGTAYTGACGWTTGATSGVEISTMTVSGAKVIATVPSSLTAGRGYKLYVPAGTFKDLAPSAQTSALVDGDSSTNGGAVDASNALANDAIYTLRAPDAVTADTTKPTLASTYPPLTETAGNAETERSMIPPSTSIQFTFSEVVQAGTGNVAVGSVNIPVSSCDFAPRGTSPSVTCKPSSLLARNTIYSVTYSGTAFKDVAGNDVQAIDNSNTKLQFSTIDLDFHPPELATTSTGTLVSEPYFPLNDAEDVAKTTVVALTFNELVQSGSGTLQFVTGGSSVNADVTVFDGKTVFATLTTANTLSAGTGGTTYTIQTAANNVFQDTAGRPFKHMTSGFTFTTLADDVLAPKVFQKVPQHDSFAAVKTDITLYFSEAVQASTVANKVVTVTDGTTTNTIPVDNSDPEQGSVSIVGSSVTIDPFNDMGYEKTVTISVSSDAFVDFFGQTNDAVGTYQFKTQAFNFGSLLGANNGSASWSDREGPLVHYSNSTLMLYGGKTSGGCASDLWTSTTGATWKLVTGKSNAPSVAYTPSASDGAGCLYVFGSGMGCSVESIMKTCNNGVDWVALPAPVVRQFRTIKAIAFPTSWTNIAMTIVGGWQLVMVDAFTDASKGVWRFFDRKMSVVQRILDTLPFSDRKDPRMLSTSDEKVFLLGGHMCEDVNTCSNNQVFTDVWMSSNSGETWVCQTANYNPALTTQYSKGVGRFTTMVMTHDDTIFLLGGQKPNSTVGLNKIYTSSSLSTPPLDVNFYASDLKTQMHSTIYRGGTTFTLHFKESIQTSGISGAPIRILNYGADNSEGGTTGDADAATGMTSSISHQVLTLSTVGALTAGRTYGVQVPKLSIQDLAGNYLPAHESFTFSVSGDTAAPTVSTVFPTGTTISPFTAVTLTMSEPVIKGVGSLRLSPVSPTPGSEVEFSIDDAIIVSNKVFFRMPVGQNLTEGVVYNYNIPAGLLQDAANNQIAAATASFGTILSGSFTIHDYKATDVVTVADIGSGNVNDTTKPTFVRMIPREGATDVPAEAGVAVLMYFSEPVRFNASGIISFKNGSGVVVGQVNLTAGSGDESKVAMMQNGTKIVIPTSKFGGSVLLKKGGKFTVSIPSGVIRDARNNVLDAVAKTFTCLSEVLDTQSPTLTMSSPATASAGLVGSLTKIDLYFSEDIEAGTGTVTVSSPAGSAGQVTTPITHSNITISGAKLTLSVYSGALNAAGTYSIQIPPGTLKEASRHTSDSRGHFTGLNLTSMRFATVAADVAPPLLTIANQLPPHESAITYGLPISSSMLLDFNEVVQASAGNIELVPKYTSPTVTIPSNSSTFSSTKVFIDPPNGLMPGEVYTVKIGATAFKDVQSNHYLGLTSGYTISTKALVSFSEQTTSSSLPARYGSGGLVDDANNVWQFGGVNASQISSSHGSADYQRFNDVLKLVTHRETNCASGGAPGNCSSASACTKVSTGVYRLGVKSVVRTVWRAPSAGGKKCRSSGGDAKSNLLETVEVETQNCPCPHCLEAPPADADPNMINTSYVGKYSLVSADSDSNTRPLYCRAGKMPNASYGAFMCIPETEFKGKFKTPYPRCISPPCTTQPSTASHAQFAAWDPTTSSRAITCSGVNSSNQMVDGETCGYKCAPGYSSNEGKYECREGNLTTTSECVKKRCSETAAQGSSVGVSCRNSNGAQLGSSCDMICADGFALSGSATTAPCHVEDTAEPETDPVFKIPPGAVCARPVTTAARAPVVTTAAVVAETPDPATTSVVSGAIAMEGTWGSATPAQFEGPVADTLQSFLDLPKSYITISCAFVDSGISSRRLTETVANQTTAASNQAPGNSTAASNQAPANSSAASNQAPANSSAASNQAPANTGNEDPKALQANYEVQVPQGYTGSQGATVDVASVQGFMASIGNSDNFKNALVAKAAEAGIDGITITGVTATSSVTAATGTNSGGSGSAGGGVAANAGDGGDSGGNTGAIVGGILGGIFGVALIGVCVFCIVKKKSNNQE
jgi:hypothetical protein